ncbi:MAG: 3-oxoacyl-[acyl-carrier-protein] reductase [Acidobacteria bacterium]|nr:3-oxoacyl-[acyl-carrier-protein] reductase [Acidobacteriota bacterium]MCH7985535.1 3-oxoacyl-[acyl-carrier-protein] reductase [Acidobacteriota bacterium]
MTLKDRVALITGASQGIGRATALLFAERGARVVLAARSADKLAAVEAEIKQAGGQALAVTLDVSDEEQVKSGIKQALEHFGHIDILVNNAAITRDQLQIRMKRADWEAVLATNLTGAHLCIQRVLPGMLRQRYGRIINVTSVVAQTGNPGQANYVASKAGLIGLTKALAVEVASRKITVNAIAPGFIISPMTDGLPEKNKQALIARIPLGRMGTDREVAYGIAFLASDQASYVTGHVLGINGGLYLA